MTEPRPYLIPPGWRAVVEDTIERLERRAAQGEAFAKLALPGWYAELQRIEEVEPTHDEESQSF